MIYTKFTVVNGVKKCTFLKCLQIVDARKSGTCKRPALGKFIDRNGGGVAKANV